MPNYLAKPTLKISGQAASDDLMEDILQIAVEESLHLPGMFTLVINNSAFSGRSGDTFWKHTDAFAIGDAIEIAFSSSTTTSSEFDDVQSGTVLKGEVTAIEVNFSNDSQAPIMVRGYDVSHRLHRGRKIRSFQEVTDSDLVNTIIGEVGISAGTVTSTSTSYPYVFQENQTAMEFLRERAARNGFELFVQDGKLNFRAPTAGTTVNLIWLQDLSSFRVRVSSADQVSEVEVRGWDYVNKTAIVSTQSAASTVQTSNEHGDGVDQSSSFSGNPSSPKITVVDQFVGSSTEADAIAQALMDELGGEFIHADAKAEGNPLIRVGKVVSLSNMDKYSGSYYVTEARHLYIGGFYSTEFSVRGLRSSDLIATLATPTRLKPGQTMLVGVVTDNKDTESLGRVKVKFPTLTEDHSSTWARVVSVGAGATRGFDCLPEIDDEVLVAFEHGDIHRPYVLGGVWNGTDAPPTVPDDSVNDTGVRLRTIQTRVGHILQFVEEDKDSSKKGIYLTTADAHKVFLDDSTKFIKVETAGGHSILLDDENKKIEVKSNGGHKITLDDNSTAKIDMISTGDINITAGSTNKITVKAQDIELNATSSILAKVMNNKLTINTSSITAEGTSATLKATAAAKVEGLNTTVSGTASVKVDGALASLEASGMAKVQGSLVKIN
jgi:phage protein D/phage baseplate assembly protein gpV